MKAEIALARANAGITRYGARMPGGGVDIFSPADVGYALAGVRTGPAGLVLAKYGPGAGTVEVLEHLVFEVCTVAAQERWDRSRWRPGWLRGLCTGALQEALSSPICGVCQGRRYVQDPETAKLEECLPCDATGYEQWSWRRRAHGCGIPRSTFDGHGLRRPYRAIRAILVGWETDALSTVKRRTRGY